MGTTHTSQIFCSNRLFLVSYRSTPGEGTMSHLLNLPIIFQHTEETDVFRPLFPLENVIHASGLKYQRVSDLKSLISFRDLTQREIYFEMLWYNRNL